jgi:hypothetical protein
LYQFFIHKIKPEDFIPNHDNIFDFCGQAKTKGTWVMKEVKVTDGEFSEVEIQKTLRYFVSKRGCKIIKENKNDGRRINVVSGHNYLTVFNQYIDKPFADYNVDYQYYIDAVNNEIKVLQPDMFGYQFNLF